jgi:hypothetical protein
LRLHPQPASIWGGISTTFATLCVMASAGDIEVLKNATEADPTFEVIHRRHRVESPQVRRRLLPFLAQVGRVGPSVFPRDKRVER